MIRHLIWLCLLFIIKTAIGGIFWEFGSDSKKNDVITHVFGNFEKMLSDKHITLSVPRCMEVKYVQVRVFNPLTAPSVSYNKDSRTVSISYQIIQLSESSYEIVAKGRRDSRCDGPKRNKCSNNNSCG